MNLLRLALLLSIVAIAPAGVRAGPAATPPPAPSPPPPADIREKSRAALELQALQKNPEFLGAMEGLVRERPDFPRLHLNLAAAYLANDRPDDAVRSLERYAALGLHSPIDRSPDFAPAMERPEFKAVLARMNANLLPVGEGTIAFTLPAMTGITEGIAARTNGEFLIGDIRHRTVWVRRRDGKVERLVPEDPRLFGVFGLSLDEAAGTLWVATTARPEMNGFAPEHRNQAGIAEIDLSSGAVRRVATVPIGNQDHVIADLARGADGSIYAPDSGAPVLWRFGARSLVPEPFVESPAFASLQGIVALPDERTLIVSDYVNGLFAIDLRTRALRPLSPPPDTTLVGIDGLVLAPDGALLAVQNGLRPRRVLRIELDSASPAIAAVKVLESGHLPMADPALPSLAGPDLVFIGNSGWTRFEPPATTANTPRPIPVFRTRLAQPVQPARK